MSRSNNRPILVAVVVTLLAAMVVVAVPAVGAPRTASARPAASAAKPHPSPTPSPRPGKGAPGRTTVGAGGVSLGSWMGDLAAHLRSRKLSQIVIPGAHDSTTYSIPEDYLSDYAITQDENLTQQLDGGIREFDVRVEYYDQGASGADYYAHHGSPPLDFFGTLTLSQILTAIQQWALAPGHGQEIILLNLSVTQDGQSFPTEDCQAFGQALGSALVLPYDLQSNFGTSDPGQVTLGQLWSLPDPKGAARVITNNQQCMNAATSYGAGEWSSYSSTYYADQCTADGNPNLGTLGNQSRGTTYMDTGAVQLRATEAGPGEPYAWGPAADGGLYELDLQSTPEADCLFTPQGMLWDDQDTLAAIYSQWQTDPATQRNLNIMEEDFVEDTDVAADAIAMDQSLPGQPDTVTRLGAERLDEPEGTASISASAFAALASYQGQAAPGGAVTYTISPATPGVGFDDAQRYTTLTVAADEQGDVNPGDDLWFPDLSGITGTWTVTASAAGGPTTASWTVVVAPTTGLQLKAVPCDAAPYNPCNPPTVGVTDTYQEDQLDDNLSFTVAAVDPSGVSVPGVPVTFDAGPAGTFPDGGNSVTVNTEDVLFRNRAAAPAFTAGTRAGTFPISVTSPQAGNTLILPFTITPDPPASFAVTQGNGQATPINSKFPIPLTGHWVDQYGNVVSDPPPADRILTLSPGDGTWANGSHGSVVVTPAADGPLTAPDLTAGKAVLDGPDAAHSLTVQVGSATGWTLKVMPGPPDEVSITSGDGQQTPAGKPFAQALAVKVTDAGGNPIPGAAVTFQVTTGQATFPPVDLRLAAAVTERPALLHQADPPRDAVAVQTNAQGVATAPVLTAGPQKGPIDVTASAGAASATKTTVFHLLALAVAPTAPIITGLTNGDGQVGVAFSGASDGTAPITSYKVEAIDQNHTSSTVTATGPSSPITVTGLTNGDPYTFAVAAISADGSSLWSAPSGALNVGVGPVLVSGPANGTVGTPYSSGFTFTWAPPPTVTFISGLVPPGLSLAGDGALTGTPTQAGSYGFTVQATNPVGILARALQS